MAYLKSGIDGGRQSSNLIRNRVMDIRGDIASPGKLILSTTEPTVVDGNKLGQIDFQAPLDTAGTDAILVGASIHAEADDTFSSSVNSTELVFSANKTGTAAERMRVAADGKVGINESAPASRLHVEGTVQVGKDDAGYDVKFFGDTASKFMLWDTSEDNLTVAGTITESSSREMKTNIEPLEDVLPSVLQMQGVQFDWKQGSDNNYGFIAEELDELFPQLVSHDEEGKAQGVQYTKVTAVLVEAIKEQQKQIDELRLKLDGFIN